MSWIESHQSLSRHKKTLRAAGLLKVDRHLLIGHLHELWWWALDNADTDGSLDLITAEEIAAAAEWPVKRADEFVQALVTAGFIEDKTGESMRLHNWYRYAGKLNDRRMAERERSKNRRSTGVQPADIGQTSNGTVPNRTVPNLTSGSKDPPKPPTRRHEPVTEDWLDSIQPDHPTVNVREVLRDAENRKTWDGYKDKRRSLLRYVGWAEEREAERANRGSSLRTGNTPGNGARRPSGDISNEERKRQFESVFGPVA